MSDYTDVALIASDAGMGGENDCLVTDHGMWIAETHHATDVDGVGIELPAQANAERLAACWNACRGIADPSVVPELVDVLEDIVQWAGCDSMEDEFRRARALLKRVRGQG